ncbi:MAG: GNAT family N-acetyltransferase [Deltaproteobacteria bacterium]|nr:GNAT family N-acetyltransferase [Deltaproteobacteria bacterium]
MSHSRDVRLRPAVNADARAVRALVFAVLEEYGLAADPGGTDADLDDIEATYRARGGSFHVLEEPGGRIVGCVGLFAVDAETCELRKMYLEPHARGLGLGRRLLDAALADAKTLGFRRVVLETATVLTEAIALYTRHGFEAYTPEHLSKRCNLAYALELKPATAPFSHRPPGN